MRKLNLFALLIAAFTGAIAAQTGPKALKFAEFGYIKAKDLEQKMSDFRGALLRDTSNQGYIIIYGTPAEISARKLILRSMPVIYDDPTRITFVDGRGTRVRTILWIVPPGATPPSP